MRQLGPELNGFDLTNAFGDIPHPRLTYSLEAAIELVSRQSDCFGFDEIPLLAGAIMAGRLDGIEQFGSHKYGHGADERLAIPDFRPRILDAMARAPMETLAEIDSVDGRIVKLLQETGREYSDIGPDDIIQFLPQRPTANQIIVTDPIAYIRLFSQAYSLIRPDKTAEEVAAEVLPDLAHELGHYISFFNSALKRTSRPRIELSTSVHGYIDPERGMSFALTQEVFPPETISRRDLALALLAPRDGPSFYDSIYVESLGFPADTRRARIELEQGRDPEGEAAQIKNQLLEGD